MSERPLIGVKEIAAYLHRSQRTVQRLLASRTLPARRVGGLWEADRPALDTWRGVSGNGRK